MIKATKDYTEQFAKEVFQSEMQKYVIEDCRSLGFEPDFKDLNNVLLANFRFDGHNIAVSMDAINAEIKVKRGNKILWQTNFAGLTDHYLFLIGSDGIATEHEYGYVFCDLYNHMGLYDWITCGIRSLGYNEDVLYLLKTACIISNRATTK